VAGGGGDGESGGDRQTRVGHLGETGTLAAEEIAHLRVAFGLLVREEIDPFLRLRSCAAGCGCTRAATNGHGGPPLRRYRFWQKRVEWRTAGALRHSTRLDRKSTRLNSSHGSISYAVFCLKKKKTQ